MAKNYYYFTIDKIFRNLKISDIARVCHYFKQNCSCYGCPFTKCGFCFLFVANDNEHYNKKFYTRLRYPLKGGRGL